MSKTDRIHRVLSGARLLVVALLLVVMGCGASQGGGAGVRVSSEAGTDALDRDGDGLREEAIFTGSEPSRHVPQEHGEICGDGEDNDGDTLVDCDDAECSMLPHCAE